jgi:hypothetical protein
VGGYVKKIKSEKPDKLKEALTVLLGQWNAKNSTATDKVINERNKLNSQWAL